VTLLENVSLKTGTESGPREAVYHISTHRMEKSKKNSLWVHIARAEYSIWPLHIRHQPTDLLCVFNATQGLKFHVRVLLISLASNLLTAATILTVPKRPRHKVSYPRPIRRAVLPGISQHRRVWSAFHRRLVLSASTTDSWVDETSSLTANR